MIRQCPPEEQQRDFARCHSNCRCSTTCGHGHFPPARLSGSTYLGKLLSTSQPRARRPHAPFTLSRSTRLSSSGGISPSSFSRPVRLEVSAAKWASRAFPVPKAARTTRLGLSNSARNAPRAPRGATAYHLAGKSRGRDLSTPANLSNLERLTGHSDLARPNALRAPRGNEFAVMCVRARMGRIRRGASRPLKLGSGDSGAWYHAHNNEEARLTTGLSECRRDERQALRAACHPTPASPRAANA